MAEEAQQQAKRGGDYYDAKGGKQYDKQYDKRTQGGRQDVRGSKDGKMVYLEKNKSV